MSKENRGEGQKMDHKRIWVTQPQLQSRHELCLGEGAVDAFLPSQPKETAGPLDQCSLSTRPWFSLMSQTEQEVLAPADAPG